MKLPSLVVVEFEQLQNGTGETKWKWETTNMILQDDGVVPLYSIG